MGNRRTLNGDKMTFTTALPVDLEEYLFRQQTPH